MQKLIRNSGRFLFGRLMPRLAYPVLSGPLKSSRFILGSLAGDGGGASVYFNKTEPEQTDAMVRELKKGQVFFDIGANVGYYSILASKIVGQQGNVLAFEPVVRNLAYLQQHVVLNKAYNVKILPFACSDENGTARFSLGPNSAMGGLTFDNVAEITGDVLVPTIKIDTIVDELGVLPDVLKIDVEGAELKVLLGATKTLQSARPTIFLSLHSAELRETCLKFLTEIAYGAVPLTSGSDIREIIAKPNTAFAGRTPEKLHQ